MHNAVYVYGELAGQAGGIQQQCKAGADDCGGAAAISGDGGAAGTADTGGVGGLWSAATGCAVLLYRRSGTGSTARHQLDLAARQLYCAGRAFRQWKIYSGQADCPLLGCYSRQHYHRRCRHRTMPLKQLADTVSFVTQDNFLFGCSLKENIRLGRPNASDDEVVAAARAAQCEDFILKLPLGYDTPAGGSGQTAFRR